MKIVEKVSVLMSGGGNISGAVRSSKIGEGARPGTAGGASVEAPAARQ
jgi:hypothetical protein